MSSSLSRHSRALELLLANRSSGRLRWGEGLQDFEAWRHNVRTGFNMFNYKCLASLQLDILFPVLYHILSH